MRQAIVVTFLLFLALAPSACRADSGPPTLVIDAARRFQTIQGFGACINLNVIQPYSYPWYQDLYAKDLGCSIIRMQLTPYVLGKELTKIVRLGDDIDANIKLMNFSDAGGPMAGTLVQTVNAKKLDRLLLIGSLWTPPHWMKRDAGINTWSNNSIGGHLKMDADNLEQFGRYVSAWVKGFEQHYGLPFYAISIQNELQFKEGYNSCQYTPAEYHDAVRAVGTAFARYGITTRIMGPEGVGPDGGFFTGKQMEWINAVKTDPAVAPYLSFFCIHGYGGNGIDMISDGAGLRDYSAKLEKFHAESWMTESSGENPAWLHSDSKGGQDGALSLARHIHEGLVYGNYNAVVYWQCSNGKPIFGETLMGGTPESAAESGKYACAKHYFRYIRPGAVRVSVEPEIATLGVSAFVHDVNHTLTIVMVNTGAEAMTVHLKLPVKPAVTKFAAFRSTEKQRFATQPDAAAADGILTVTIPAQAVETLNGQE